MHCTVGRIFSRSILCFNLVIVFLILVVVMSCANASIRLEVIGYAVFDRIHCW